MVNSRPVIFKEQIFSQIQSLDIFKRYVQNFVFVDKHFLSEFRRDTKPSCCISFINGDYLYHDFGTGESHSAIGYVMRKFGITYREALELIVIDFKIELNGQIRLHSLLCNNNNSSGSIQLQREKDNKSSERKQTHIRIKTRPWQSQDRHYWFERYTITRATLSNFQVRPISHFWINDKIFYADKCAYSYEFYTEEQIFRRKIYQPLSKTNRFFSNGGKIVQGEGLLPYSGNLLVITKSLKDIMVLYQMGITSISPTSETSFLPEQYLLKQRKRFDRLVLLLDQDECGRIKSKEFSEKWNIPYILIPEEVGYKDISDVVYGKGVDFAKKLMKELL